MGIEDSVDGSETRAGEDKGVGVLLLRLVGEVE